MIDIKRCEWETISKDVCKYFEDNRITIDSFWEEHVLSSNHYQIMDNQKQIGFFAIHNQTMITLFHLIEDYGNYGQEIFAKIKKYEQVTNAFVATGDEFFLSHCMDSYMRIDKQAYFSIYTDKPLKSNNGYNLDLIEVKTEEDIKKLSLAKDFFDEDTNDKILKELSYFKVYLVEDNGDLVGFGVIEYSRVVNNIGSIGMYVMEDKRQRGYAAGILKKLQGIVERNGRRAHSGCWYYNHNSKKSMESAGAFSKTRLLRFYF